jgi:hypothetical protein
MEMEYTTCYVSECDRDVRVDERTGACPEHRDKAKSEIFGVPTLEKKFSGSYRPGRPERD